MDVIIAAASKTLRQNKNPTHVVFTAADLICTLPPSTRATRGKRVTVQTGVASSSTGVQINPASGDTLKGKGITAAADKNYINTGATDAVGDSATFVADGAGSWYLETSLGTWDREA